MMVNDTVADMLTRIRNANAMKYKTVEIPGTKLTKGIADILTKEGFIAGYDVNKLAVGEMLVVNLKYSKSKERVINGLKRISKPGLRVYAKADEMPRVLNGLGIAIVSTSEGLMTDKEARAKKIGGEVLAYIW
ncbi:MAG: 30S ribosomal protein S8 [Bacilli bacterium]|nr:30S ribosomal protein S8 [Bacilli bacterium]